jgi:hypothetical protein
VHPIWVGKIPDPFCFNPHFSQSELPLGYAERTQPSSLDGERIQSIMKKFALVMGLLGVLLTTAFGQGNVLHAKIPFEFAAGANTLPAGNYDFSVSNRAITIKNTETGKSFDLGFLTRIAADKTAMGTARISYDVQEGKHSIEAIWPAQGDGYLVQTVKGEHTHEIVRSK